MLNYLLSSGHIMTDSSWVKCIFSVSQSYKGLHFFVQSFGPLKVEKKQLLKSISEPADHFLVWWFFFTFSYSPSRFCTMKKVNGVCVGHLFVFLKTLDMARPPPLFGQCPKFPSFGKQVSPLIKFSLNILF